MFRGQQTGLAIGPFAPATVEGTRLAAVLPPGAGRDALERAALPVRAIRPHGELAREGAAPEHLHIILDGWACRYRATRHGTRQIVAFLLPGDVAGSGVTMGGSDGCGVRALTATQILSIPRNRVATLANQYPAIERALFRLVLAENASLARWLSCIGRGTARQRLAHLLCELAVRSGADGGQAATFRLPLTQEQLGDALGLTSVHVNRTLQELREEGLFTRTGRMITLPDMAQLRQRADFDAEYLTLDATTGDDGDAWVGGYGTDRTVADAV